MVIGLGQYLAVAAILPRERNFTRSEGLAVSGRQMVDHLRNPQLVSTYAVGFGILFTFVALFTYVNFVLAAPPFDLSPTMLGAIFVTYLAGAVAVLGLGRAIARFAPDGRVVRTIEMPVRHPTSVSFGGPDLDILFVTSISRSTSLSDEHPDAGGLFAIEGLGIS